MNSRFHVHKPQWEENKSRIAAWWNRSSLGRPMIYAVVPRQDRLAPVMPVPEPGTMQVDRRYLDVEANVLWFRNVLNGNRYLGESLPSLSLNLGPGSVALYLGSEPEFQPDTLWFSEVVEDWETHPPLRYDPDNKWWVTHQAMHRRAVELANGEFLVCIPDLVESIDILAALRGPQRFCYDLLDTPDEIKRRLAQVDALYFKYYDPLYDLVKTPDGGSAYTAFEIWGPGKTAKVQCDFSALMSPDQFSEFMIPSLGQQCAALDCSLYHLDGIDAIKHLDALMGVKELDALQWTAGAGKSDNGSECWYPIYDKVKKAGKSLWISTRQPSFEALLGAGDRLVNRYGADGLYLLLWWDGATEEQGLRLMDHAEKHWKH
jgi:5-methyltetrahydrofolate--homocysteine methyltransferase